MTPRAGLALAFTAWVGCAAAQAAALRDPTVPPPAWGAQPGSPREPLAEFKPGHLVVVDGRRYVMWQGRRYGEGESIEGARIERIEETEVWLRIAGSLRKVRMFAGIEKRPSAAPAGADATGEMRK